MKNLPVFLALTGLFGFLGLFYPPQAAHAQVGVIPETAGPARVEPEPAPPSNAEAKPDKPAEATTAEPAKAAPEEPAAAAPESPVGVAPGGPGEPEPSRVALRLGGGCEVNEVESTLLRMKGVVGVDVESKRGHMVIDYDPIRVTSQQLTDELARKKGCFAPIVK